MVINIGVDNSVLLNNVFFMVNNLFMLIFVWFIFRVVGSILNNVFYMFWGELNFNFLFMYMKIEGMYIEFRVLIGMVIYDFIWFENVVVRSSIILWIIIS